MGLGAEVEWLYLQGTEEKELLKNTENAAMFIGLRVAVSKIPLGLEYSIRHVPVIHHPHNNQLCQGRDCRTRDIA